MWGGVSQWGGPRSAAKALGGIGPNAAAAVPQLVEALKDDDYDDYDDDDDDYYDYDDDDDDDDDDADDGDDDDDDDHHDKR